MSADLVPAALRQPAIGDGSFPAGTPIAVPSGDGAPGEVAVESLARGDRVLTLAGPVAVRHVARSTVAPAPVGPDSPPRPRLIPVLVAAGAFGEGQPNADLLLPPEQLVHVLDPALPQGALVPLGALVNGETIRRAPQDAPVGWVRLELERPGVVIAAGLLVAARHDPTAPPPAPMLPAGPATAALRARLARPAAPPAAAPPVVEVPAAVVEAPAAELPPVAAAPAGPTAALQVLAGGAALPPLADSSDVVWHFALPEGTVAVRLVSPRGLPAGTDPAARAQARRFGVAVRAILLDDAPLALDGPAIGAGFHGLESAGGESWRWTDGSAELSLPPGRRLTVAITDWHLLLQPE